MSTELKQIIDMLYDEILEIEKFKSKIDGNNFKYINLIVGDKLVIIRKLEAVRNEQLAESFVETEE